MRQNISRLLVGLLFLTPAFAVGIENPLANTFKDIPSIVNWASSYVLPVSTVALLGIIVYAGFIKMTAIGNPDKEKMAMQTLTSGIVGFALILSSSLVVGILGAMLGIRLLNIT
jgi:hypothetical protein